ncbi:MAG: DUF4271 domain-containing protein [Mucinivorans sp.]
MEQQLLDRVHQMYLPLDTTISIDSLTTLQKPAAHWTEIFSSSGVRVPVSSLDTLPVGESLTTDSLTWATASIITCLIALYCYTIYRHNKSIVATMKAMFSLEDTFFIFENLASEFKHFLSISRLVFAVTIAVSLVVGWFDRITEIDQLWLFGAIVVSFYLSIAIQDSLRLLVSRFDSSPDRILVLRKVTIFDLSIVSLVFCPLALVITTIGLSDLWLWVSLAFLIITHWVRLFLYFKFTGFSILQWFLYLCTLEVLPFTIIIGVVGHIKNL